MCHGHLAVHRVTDHVGSHNIAFEGSFFPLHVL